jgi:DNA polymerase I-like protein with 3'-5' exonuclease and polymerase domains
MTNPELKVLVHNTLYDVVILHEREIVPEHMLRAQLLDTMVLQFLIDEEQPKDLKDMVLRFLYYRMRTYKEVTDDHPASVRIREIDGKIAGYLSAIDAFERRRPWPGFDGDRIKVKSDVMKGIKAHMAATWPGTPTANNRRIYTPEERAARAAYEAEQTALVEKHFGYNTRLEFMAWVHETQLPVLEAEKTKLQADLVASFTEYAKDDGRQMVKLWAKLEPLVRKGHKNNPPLDYWLDIELAVREVTTRSSCRGLPIDIGVLQDLGKVLDPLIDEFDAEIKNMARGFTAKDGSEFNPNSADQLRTLLFEVLGCSPPTFRRTPDGRTLPKFTPEGNKLVQEMEEKGTFIDLRYPETLTPNFRAFLSGDAEVLERIDHPIGLAILNYRTVRKLRDTYVTAGIDRVQLRGNGRIAGILNSIGAGTGRHTSSGPNLQNIPSRKKPEFYDDRVLGLGPEIRKAFVAEKGKKLIVADQSQIELRLIAEECAEPTLLAIYREGIEIDGVFFYTGDVHTRTATQLNIPRKLAKNVNFGFNYGMGPPKFARQIRLYIPGTKEYDIAKAAAWRDGFFNTYPMVLARIDDLDFAWKVEKIRDFRMVSGRLRHFNDNWARGGKILNSKIQGSSADIIKLNMVIIDRYVRPLVPSLELLFQVHDELGYQADESEAAFAAEIIKFVMEYSWFSWLSVPILASAKVCDNWSAKDDDDVPEVGLYYACVDGHHRVFSQQTWSEFRTLEKQKAKITAKCATAMLSSEQVRRCTDALDPMRIKRELRLPTEPIT